MFISCQNSHNTHTSENLTDHLWTLQSFEPIGEGKIPVNKNEEYNIEFLEDSTFKGQSNCNNYSGTYNIFGNDSLNLTFYGLTQKYCGEKAFQKIRYFDALFKSVISYKFKENTLVLYYDDGKSKLSFK